MWKTIRNDTIPEALNKGQDRRLHSYRYVMGREESHFVMKTLDLQLKGRRRTRKPKNPDGGKSKDMREKGLSEGEMRDDRNEWKHKIRNKNS